MTERKRLPNRRDSDALTFSHEGHTVHATVSFDADGKLAEIFLNSGKTGTLIDIVMREMAVVVSIALQYGVPRELIENALPKLTDNSPAGPLGSALRRALEPWPQTERARTISAPDGARAKDEGGA